MEGKKFKGSCGNHESLPKGRRANHRVQTCWGFPTSCCCQYYHLTDSRTHCPPENRGDEDEEDGAFFPSPESRRFFLQTVFYFPWVPSRWEEEWVLGT
ncbi:hypothetical protein ACRRTK_023062 [Alexandromys fortis]